MVSVTKPKSGDFDSVASQRIFGWNPDSGDDAPLSYGELSIDAIELETELLTIVDKIHNSDLSFLLEPIKDIDEPEIFPLISNPIEENMVVINPHYAEQSGLVPLAALWQSGWEKARPYMLVRSGVYERLLAATNILKTIDERFTICITDGWRSHELQQELYDAFYPDGLPDGEVPYVSVPQMQDEYAAPHPSGGAVDVLPALSGQAIHLGSKIDHMDRESYVGYFEETPGITRDMRRIFTNLLNSVGFATISSEWWHVEYGTRRWAGKTGEQPLYGNAVVNESDVAGINPVQPIVGSRRAQIMAHNWDHDLRR